MQHKFTSNTGLAILFIAIAIWARASGQQVQTPAAATQPAVDATHQVKMPQVYPGAWRGAGPIPYVGSDGGIQKAPAELGVKAIRAGRLFDSNTAQMLTDQIVIVSGELITQVGPGDKVKIPEGAQVIDFSRATVLPGLIDAHTHMFNNRKPETTTEASMLVAVQNANADLRAGFTAARDMSSHGNGYGDVAIRDAINEGRIDGPRYQVATRGIVWGLVSETGNPALTAQAVHNEEQARAAVREQISHGADWIKLYPTGGYTFTPAGELTAKPTYPLPILQAIVDETHLHGKKIACHVFAGEGERNAIIAGSDTIEHAFGLDQEQADMMVRKGLYYDPTLVRYTLPMIDDTDAKSTGGKYGLTPIFYKAVTLAAATRGLNILVGSGADGSTYAHGTQGVEFEALVKHTGMSPSRVIQAATKTNAQMMGWQDQIGSIDKNKYADVIAVAGDPLADISEMQRVKFVMKGGKVIRNDMASVAPASTFTR